ncbi:MAG: dihydrofolate reductase [Clostridiales bacterium]|nr:dihydrofolate reductase [Candidatus Crickella equi]
MNLIVAVDKNWGIGRDNGLLAHLPGDMAYFKATTSGKTVVMGRKTLESMPGKRGLPNRTNYVLTSNPDFAAERCIVVNSEDELMKALSAFEPDDVFLIGGASIYNKYYKMCDKLYITKMDADLNADTRIVNIDEDGGFEVVSESEPMTENGVTYRFLVYERKK